MSKKLFLLTLCFTVLLAPMLFGSENSDVDVKEPMPELQHIRIVPVQHLPKTYDGSRQEDSLYYCLDLSPANAIGFNGAMDWEGAIRLTSTELGPYAGWDIIAISWYHWNPNTYSNSVLVYDEGTPTTPGSVITTEPYNTTVEEWVRVDLSSPVPISGSTDLWCSIAISQTVADFPLGCDPGPAIDGKGDWIYYSGSWNEIQNLGLDYNWYILAIVEDAVQDTHDVGSVSFLNPGTLVQPGNLDVIGEVENFGTTSESYDVHCLVQDPTFAVVLDTTINVTTGVGERDTINFGPVNFEHGYTYDLMMATLLVDNDPGNDTITQQTICSAAYWEILPNMPYTTSGPYVGYHVDSLGYTFVHIFGGNPGPQANHYIYDYANGTYATGTSLPTASTYGGTVSFNNMIYLCGAWTGASNVITIYDCINDTYTTRTLPGGGRANATAVSKDNRYVYVIGGYPGWQGGTAVDVYDAIADTFFSSPTQLPANCACMSAGGALIAGDTIIVAAGYDGTANMTNRVVYGVIDPVDPGTITWGIHGTTYPAGNCYRGAGDGWGGIGYFTGGSNNTVYFTETYSYEAGVGWVTLPLKPTGCMNLGWVMAPVDTQYTDDAEILGFAMGGYSPYMNIGEAYHTGMIVTGIVENPNEGIGSFSCKLISSNPISSGNAYIQLVMPTEGPVKFSVYDVTGRRILSREFSRIHAGTHTIRWERKNDQGTSVSAGNYFYRVEAAGNVTAGKLVIIN